MSSFEKIALNELEGRDDMPDGAKQALIHLREAIRGSDGPADIALVASIALGYAMAQAFEGNRDALLAEIIKMANEVVSAADKHVSQHGDVLH